MQQTCNFDHSGFYQRDELMDQLQNPFSIPPPQAQAQTAITDRKTLEPASIVLETKLVNRQVLPLDHTAHEHDPCLLAAQFNSSIATPHPYGATAVAGEV